MAGKTASRSEKEPGSCLNSTAVVLWGGGSWWRTLP